MSQSASESTSGNVVFGDQNAGRNNLIQWAIIAAVAVFALWIYNRKKS